MSGCACREFTRAGERSDMNRDRGIHVVMQRRSMLERGK